MNFKIGDRVIYKCDIPSHKPWNNQHGTVVGSRLHGRTMRVLFDNKIKHKHTWIVGGKYIHTSNTILNRGGYILMDGTAVIDCFGKCNYIEKHKFTCYG
jgi:hypothetical protein